MARNLFLAKSKPLETIVEHTDELIRQYNILKKYYPEIPYIDWHLLYIACLYHDLGKMNTKFQNKVQKEKKLIDPLPHKNEVPHGYLSAAFLPKDILKEKYNYNDSMLRVLYQTVFYHHPREEVPFDEIKDVVKKDLPNYINNFHYDKLIAPLNLTVKFSKFVTSKILRDIDEPDIVRPYIMTKGLLNRIDFAASANSSRRETSSELNVEEPNVGLQRKTINYIQTKGRLNDLQEYMLKNQEENNIIVASTGIGKTEAALCWIGNNKGFFTLPLKVSINSIYDRVRNEINFNNTGLLHSDTSSEYLKRLEKDESIDLTMIDKTRQLCYPLTVCTLDQIIDFVFKYPGFEPKLATLAYSKLVIDEIQMYSPELVGYLIVGLKQIIELGGKFTIMTATFPPIIEHFMKKVKIPFKKSEKPFIKLNKDGNEIVRHHIKVIQKNLFGSSINIEEKDKKILIIVNTIKKAQEIYQELEELGVQNLHLLHSRFTRKDRRKKEDQILDLGKRDNREAGVWVTTQIVEASLDIDFDVLYTELSEVCGLFQRMGRVYRNRDLVKESPNVYVFTGNPMTSGIKKSDKSVVDIDIFTQSKKQIEAFGQGILTEKKKIELVEKVYSRDVLRDSKYYNDILKTINLMDNLQAFTFKKKDINLRNIDSEIIIPHSIYRDNEDIIQQGLKLIKEHDNWLEKITALNQIKEFCVQIPGYALKNAQKNKLIEHQLEISKYEKVYVISYNYSTETGLVFKEDIETTFF